MLKVTKKVKDPEGCPNGSTKWLKKESDFDWVFLPSLLWMRGNEKGDVISIGTFIGHWRHWGPSFILLLWLLGFSLWRRKQHYNLVKFEKILRL